ncbi:MAG: peptidoglycan-binding protein, partial [Pseudomonadota bacterium]
MAEIQPGRPTSGVEAGLPVSNQDKGAGADRGAPSNPGSGADGGRAFDQAVADGKAADRPSPNNSGSAQPATSAASASASNASIDVGASNSPTNLQASTGANGASGANGVGSAPVDTAALNGGSNAPAVSSAPNAAVANGPTNAPVGHGVSNAPVANGAVNPSLSTSSPTPAFAEGRTQIQFANAAATSAASTPNSVTPPPLAKDPAAGSEAQLRFESRDRGDHTIGPTNGSSSNRPGERADAVMFDLPVLRLGASDRSVGLLQRALALLGSIELLSERGFGALTEQAVRSFQEGVGLIKDGVVGNRETWPAINRALVTRHEGITRLADAMSPGTNLATSQVTELKQLAVLLGEFSERALPTSHGKEMALMVGASREAAVPGLSLLGDAAFAGRASHALTDAARAFSLPIGALMAASPELTRSYLVLQGQLLAMPNPVRERRFRRQPKQLHPADPEGHLANINMNPDFVVLVNGLIAGLRGDGHDVRVIAGFR